MPTNSKMKRRVRERMNATGEKYTEALRAIEAEDKRAEHASRGRSVT